MFSIRYIFVYNFYIIYKTHINIHINYDLLLSAIQIQK
jgi:hypothetical protein